MSVTLTDEKHAELVRMLDTIVRGCDAHAYDIGLSLDPLRDLLKEVAALTREPAPTITPKDTIQEAIAWIEACTGKEAQHIDEGTLSLLGRLQALTREPAPADIPDRMLREALPHLDDRELADMAGSWCDECQGQTCVRPHRITAVEEAKWGERMVEKAQRAIGVTFPSPAPAPCPHRELLDRTDRFAAKVARLVNHPRRWAGYECADNEHCGECAGCLADELDNESANLGRDVAEALAQPCAAPGEPSQEDFDGMQRWLDDALRRCRDDDHARLKYLHADVRILAAARRFVAAQPCAPADAHPDDLAVDRFAAALKAKLSKKRLQGAGGWETASAEWLNKLLIDHLTKGDPVDVGNFAMMLWNNGQKCAPADAGEWETAYEQRAIKHIVERLADGTLLAVLPKITIRSTDDVLRVSVRRAPQQGGGGAERKPVCSRCKDTHQVDIGGEGFDERIVMCTSCPTPCQRCRRGGNGAYCEITPCSCSCHGTPKGGDGR